MTLSLRFPHSYEVRVGNEVQGEPTRSYASATGRTYAPPLVVQVEPVAGRPWVGAFSGATKPDLVANGCFTTPDPSTLCVVANGQGYVVSAADPDQFQLIEEAMPITDVADAPELGLILFADFTHVCAYSANGLAWTSERIASDGLRIASARRGEMKGYAWSAPDRGYIPFTLDLSTGRHVGGIDLSRYRLSD
jgi:hypothetical protein